MWVDHVFISRNNFYLINQFYMITLDSTLNFKRAVQTQHRNEKTLSTFFFCQKLYPPLTIDIQTHFQLDWATIVIVVAHTTSRTCDTCTPLWNYCTFGREKNIRKCYITFNFFEPWETLLSSHFPFKKTTKQQTYKKVVFTFVYFLLTKRTI
jgi:hypothetical protein